MTIKERFERFNNSVDKFADGKHIRCFVNAIFESVVFKYPTTFYFNYDFFAKKCTKDINSYQNAMLNVMKH